MNVLSSFKNSNKPQHKLKSDITTLLRKAIQMRNSSTTNSTSCLDFPGYQAPSKENDICEISEESVQEMVQLVTMNDVQPPE